MISLPRRLLVPAALLAIGLGLASSTLACPMCADNLPSGGATRKAETALADNPASGAPSPALAEGFYYSILALLGVPITLVAGGGVATYRALNRKPPIQ